MRNARAVERFRDPDRTPPLLPGMVLAVMQGVLAALLQAHAKGYVHLDVKHTNVMHHMIRGAGEEDTVAMLDWGNSHKIGALIEGQVGTPGFMAPEIAEVGRRGKQGGCVTADPSQDVFSCGILGCILVSGDSPGRVHKFANACLLHPNLLHLCGKLFGPDAGAAVADALSAAVSDAPSDRPSAVHLLAVMDKCKSALCAAAAADPRRVWLARVHRQAPRQQRAASPPPSRPMASQPLAPAPPPASPPHSNAGAHASSCTLL